MNKFYLDQRNSCECQCGKSKTAGFPFCYLCYTNLSKDLQKNLFNMQVSYEETYDKCLEYLNE